LDRFWSPLGVINIDFSLVFIRFHEKSRFFKNYCLKAVLDRSLVDLVSIRAPQGSQDGTQDGTKKHPKIMLKIHQNFDRFLIENGVLNTPPRPPNLSS